MVFMVMPLHRVLKWRSSVPTPPFIWPCAYSREAPARCDVIKSISFTCFISSNTSSYVRNLPGGGGVGGGSGDSDGGGRDGDGDSGGDDGASVVWWCVVMWCYVRCGEARCAILYCPPTWFDK